MSTLTDAASKLGLSLSPEKPQPVVQEKAQVGEDIALRPTSVQDMIGNDRVRVEIRMLVEAAKRRGEQPGHILLSGPPGCGKNTLARIVADATGGELFVATASAVRTVKNLGRWLARLPKGAVGFIDEIHGMPSATEELLYGAMEDRRIEVITGTGKESQVVTVNLEPFTLVAATTKLGKISEPAQQRFDLVAHLEYYTADQLAEITLGFALRLDVEVTEDACCDIARRSKGTARVALKLFKKARDYAQTQSDGIITAEMVAGAMAIAEIDPAGLTMNEQLVLLALCDDLKGGPSGFGRIATAAGVDVATVADACAYLVRAKFITQSSGRGTTATRAGYAHLNQAHNANLAVPLDLGL